MTECTSCAVLTPTGRGAIAVVEVRGPNREQIVDSQFRAASSHALTEQPVDAVRYGEWRSTGEEVIVVRRADSIEIQCHGGTAAVASIVMSLGLKGCQQVEAWNHASAKTVDPIGLAAERALAEASTERVASLIVDQWQGALRSDFQEILNAMEIGEIIKAGQLLQKLTRRSRLGRHLTRPWRVVLAGAANVGKSSLINALVGYERAIVFDQPGTTRDAVTANTAIDGWPVLLCDTAGLRTPGDDLEAAGIEVTRESLAKADLVVLVAEAAEVTKRPQSTIRQLESWHRLCPSDSPVLVIISKCDQVRGKVADAAAVAIEQATPWPCVLTSSVNRQGIEELLWRVGNELVPSLPPAGSGIPFASEHFAAIGDAIASLQKGDSKSAASAIAQLL